MFEDRVSRVDLSRLVVNLANSASHDQHDKDAFTQLAASMGGQVRERDLARMMQNAQQNNSARTPTQAKQAATQPQAYPNLQKTDGQASTTNAAVRQGNAAAGSVGLNSSQSQTVSYQPGATTQSDPANQPNLQNTQAQTMSGGSVIRQANVSQINTLLARLDQTLARMRRHERQEGRVSSSPARKQDLTPKGEASSYGADGGFLGAGGGGEIDAVEMAEDQLNAAQPMSYATALEAVKKDWERGKQDRSARAVVFAVWSYMLHGDRRAA